MGLCLILGLKEYREVVRGLFPHHLVYLVVKSVSGCFGSSDTWKHQLQRNVLSKVSECESRSVPHLGIPDSCSTTNQAWSVCQ